VPLCAALAANIAYLEPYGEPAEDAAGDREDLLGGHHDMVA
jgi:hypothetical protein